MLNPRFIGADFDPFLIGFTSSSSNSLLASPMFGPSMSRHVTQYANGTFVSTASITYNVYQDSTKTASSDSIMSATVGLNVRHDATIVNHMSISYGNGQLVSHDCDVQPKTNNVVAKQGWIQFICDDYITAANYTTLFSGDLKLNN